MRLIYFSTFFILLTFIQCESVVSSQKHVDSQFGNYVDSILVDPLNRWHEYPKPPSLTDEVLFGLKEELVNDSAKFYFEKLGPNNSVDHSQYMASLNYFESHGFGYCVLAMLVHWNPDARTYTAMELYSKLKADSQNGKIEAGKMSSENLVKLRFLIYILESNPLIISGSENSTIHQNYLSNMAWCIDILTGENLTDRKYLSEWYKNDLNFESIVLKWKEHLRQ